MSEKVEKRDVTFRSADNLCAAWFFLRQPAAAGARVPAVAMAHGVGAVKEIYIDFFARRFAQAGIAALLFDYRFFGASGGEPKRLLEVDGGHYSVYRGPGADQAGRAAADWFTKHLAQSS